MPIEECPLQETRDNDPPNVVLLGNFLNVVLTDWCTRNKLASNLVASGADLKAVVRSRVFGEPSPDIPLTRGWREAHVLTELHAILNGEKAIRVENPEALAPLGFTAVDSQPRAGKKSEAKLPLPIPPSD